MWLSGLLLLFLGRWLVRDSLFWVLVLAVVMTALFVVNSRHQHRVAYLAFQEQEDVRDKLNDEWGMLLIEKQLWSSPAVIEKDSREKLSMRAPSSSDIEFIELGASNSEVQHASR